MLEITRRNLKNQIICLVLVPLAFECAFVFALQSALISAESTARKEAYQKRIIAAASESQRDLLQFFRDLLSNLSFRWNALESRQWSNVGSVVVDPQKSIANAKLKMTELESLLAADQDSQELVKKLRQDSQNLQDTVEKSRSETPVQRLLRGSSSVRMTNEALGVVLDDLQSVVDLHRQLADELSPKSESARSNFRTVLIVGLVVNVFLTILMSWIFGATIVRRINHLMFNVRNFEVGNKAFDPVGGIDEIAALDTQFRDVANKKLRAEQLRREMMSMVSHDLRSPLTSVRAYLSMLNDEELFGPIGPDNLKRIFARIDSELSRLVRLANSLLDLERVESGRLELYMQKRELQSLIDDSLFSMQGAALEKDITLSTEIATQERTINCDRERIIQVLVNLVSNALKFSPRSSKVTVAVCDFEGGFKFSVQDEGPGIKLEEAGRLFEKFSQLSQDEELLQLGSGLGLSLCKTIVELHGGKIAVETAVEKGALIWFTLPVTTQPTS